MEERVYQGHIYRRAGPGEPWQMAGPAPKQSGGGWITDPYKESNDRRADQDQGFEAERVRLAQQAAGIQQQAEARQQATAPYDAQKAAADAAKASIDAEKARRDLQAAQATASPTQQKAMAALADDEVLSAIGRAREGVDAGYSAGYWARLGKIPGIGNLVEPQNAIDLEGSLNTIASRLTLDKLAQLKQASPTGASGLGSLTEREGALLRDSVAALGQTQSPDKLRESLAAVEKHYRNYMALAAGEDYRDPQVAAKFGIAALPVSGETGERAALAQGATREEADPALKGVNNRIRGMLGAGAPAADIVGYMNSVVPGLGDKRATDVAAQVRFRAQNPNVPLGRYVISVENREVPMSGTRQLINDAAQTPGGAYFSSAVDALSMGTVDNMQENPALARAGMKAMSEESPVASLLGTLSGGALAGALGEGAVGAAGAWAPRIADTLYGAAYGAGSSDEGDRLSGAGWGMLGGVAGGEIGRRGMQAAGSATRGVQNEAAQFLRERDVPLTIGQILGGASKAKEDRLAGFGGIGDRINGQRRAGIEGWNRAVFDEGLEPIGQARIGFGEDGVEAARGLISGPGGAYDQALSGVSLVPDAPFANDVAAALASGTALPRVGPEFRAYVDANIAPHFGAPNGQIDGRQMQDVIQQARGADFGTDAMGGMASDSMRGIEGAVADLAGRQAPGVMEDFGNANTAYRNLNILADAVGKGINTDGLFMPSQLGQAARTNTTKFGGKIAAATPDRPFYELQRAGQQVLPSRIPDSGTAGRADQGSVTGIIARALRNMKGAVVYNDTLQEPIARALLDRPAWADPAGQWMQDRSRIAGLLARPLALTSGPLAVTSDY